MAIVHQDTIKYLAFRFVTGFLCMTLLIALGICKVNFRGKNLKYAIICGLCNPLVSQVLETSSTRFAPTAQILYSGNFETGFAAEDRVVAGDILISAIKAQM